MLIRRPFRRKIAFVPTPSGANQRKPNAIVRECKSGLLWYRMRSSYSVGVSRLHRIASGHGGERSIETLRLLTITRRFSSISSVRSHFFREYGNTWIVRSKRTRIRIGPRTSCETRSNKPQNATDRQEAGCGPEFDVSIPCVQIGNSQTHASLMQTETPSHHVALSDVRSGTDPCSCDRGKNHAH